MIISELHESIEKTKKLLHDYCESLVFEMPISFKDFLERNDVSAPGLYKIEINVNLFTKNRSKWKDDFILFWDGYKGQSKRTPSSKKKRLKIHPDTIQDDWIPLYIGRSLNVKNRIELHIKTPFDVAYQALKFEARGIKIDKNFRISFCKLAKEHYDLTSLAAEEFFRERFSPIVGNKG